MAVAGASDGVEAVDSALRLRPDIIVMDFQLPERDGCEATRILKQDERTRAIPVLLLTGHVHERFVERARAAGCDAFLWKPFPLDRLRAEIERLLGRAPSAPIAAAGRVLIVEDDDDIRETLQQVLEQEGYVVDTAAHGREALEHLHNGHRPDVILLDLMMPVMDGWQFREAQQHDPQLATIPVVILTAAEGVRSFEPRPRALLRKPIQLPQLFEALSPKRSARESR
jgi:CheY-like chemotaxis protein